MEESVRIQLRCEGNTHGGVLLIYMGIMNVSVVLLMFLSLVMQMISVLAANPQFEINENLINGFLEKATEFSNWGYLLAIGLGLALILLWKKPKYFCQTIFAPGGQMKAKDFLLITIVFFSGQQLFQWWYLLMEAAANGLGFSLETLLESATVSDDSIPIFLYACLLGPIAEEILLRGLILRSLQPYGKKFAILVSSLLFGLFHGNLLQVPFAFFVGLVMGYVALEYNIYWAILLHLMNNLVFADLVPRVLSLLPEGMDDLILAVFLLICSVGTVLILILRWRDVRDYWKGSPTEKGTYAAFFLAPAMIVFMAISALIIIALPMLALLQ